VFTAKQTPGTCLHTGCPVERLMARALWQFLPLFLLAVCAGPARYVTYAGPRGLPCNRVVISRWNLLPL
jgi:hypothetical protein